MSEWITKELGSLIGTNISSIGKDYPFQEISYLDTGSITKGKVDGYQPFDLKDAPSRAKRLVQENDIIYSSVRPIQRHYGFISTPKENLVVSTGFVVITCNQRKLNPKYLYYYLTSDQIVEELDVIAEASTSAYPSLKPSDIERLELYFSSDINEQKAIAAVLSSLDDKIDLLHRQNKTLEAMAETLFRQWFIEEAGEDWEEKKLKDILDFVVDNRGKTAPTADTGIPLIATNCIKNNNIFPMYEKIRYVSEETYNNWFRSHPLPGDIIFVNKGTPGCINIVPNPVDFCIAQDMVSLRANKKYVSNYYLFFYLRGDDMQNHIINSSVGTTIPHLKKTDLLEFLIQIPKLEVLERFDNVIDDFFKKMNQNQKQIRTLEKLRDTLLPKLMSGEVRVKIA